MMFYTGVGSRKIDHDTAELLTVIGERMAALGYILRSGGATGSDTAFQTGACKINPKLTQIWLPRGSFGSQKHLTGNYRVVTSDQVQHGGSKLKSLAIIPQFDSMSEFAQKAHGRNYYQVFGTNGEPDTRVCIYAAPEKNGVVGGGTRSAVYLARYLGVPTYNVLIQKQKEELLIKLKMEI